MDDNGNAIIIWRESDGSNVQVFKSEYRNGAWTHPADLSDNISPDGQDISTMNLSMDGNDNAIITWSQFDGTYRHLFISEYRNGAWTHPADLTDNISPAGMNPDYPVLVMDDMNNVILVYKGSNGSNLQIFKSEFRDGLWTHPADLSDSFSFNGYNASSSNVIMDNNGYAIIVCVQNTNIYMSEYR
jgi:mRNA-degrading endonuclease HigB of HigAB toxin-antitoxin module